ncbi:MAG: MBL fold metallo-hydrolase [Gammaproteobacteria bacterium]|nr:MBL fold metallo-hydrolase [Gammaproteobacteria bacterium]
MNKLLRGLLILGIAFGAVAWLAVSTRTGQDLLLPRLINAAMQSQSVTRYDGIRVFMCGTASPLPSPDRAQACIAVMAGETLYLVDAGEGSSETFNLFGESTVNIKAVLITHFHSDHISGIPDFNLNSWVSGRKAPLVLIGPAGVERIAEGFNEAFALDRSYRVSHHGEDLLPPALGELGFREIAPDEVWQDGELRISAFPVDHGPVKPAVGYRFDYKGRSVVISGDSNAVDSLVTAVGNADLLLHDALSMPMISAMEEATKRFGRERQSRIMHDIQNYHAHASMLGKAAEQAGVKMLAAYHLVPPPRNALMENVFLRDLPEGTVLTRDGMVFELPAENDGITVHEP